MQRLKRHPKLAFASFFFSYFGYIGVVTPFVSLYLAFRGFSVLEIATLMSLFQVTRIVGPFAWGWLADHLQARVAVLRASALAALVVFLPLPWLNGFAALFVWLLLLNSLTSAQVPVGEAVIVQSLREQGSEAQSGFDLHYGRLRLWGSLGFIVAVLAGGALTQHYGITLFPWLGVGLLAMVCVTVFALHEPHTAYHHAETTGSMRGALALPEVRWFLLASFCMVFAHAALYVFYSLYLEKLGYSKFVIGVMWTLGVLAEVVFFWFQGAVFARFTVRALLLAACLIAAFRFTVMGIAPHFGALEWLILGLAQLLHAATFGVHHSASLKQLQQWFAGPLQARGQALFTSIAYGLGGSLGGLMSGWVWTHWGAGETFVVSGASALLGAFAVWRCFAVQKTR